MFKLLTWHNCWHWLKTEKLLVAIILLASLLRGYQLGQVPHGLTWDEAAVGYNGYAVISTRRDEWLHRIPISFRSFGDYKAPLAIYLNGLFTTGFGLGLSPWAIRLPFALSGVIAVVGFYYLTRELTSFLGLGDASLSKNLGYLAAAWLAISPWHLHFTRTGFESGLAVSIIIWASWLSLLALKKPSWWLWILAGLSWCLSLYAYHSAKIVVPLLLLGLVVWQKTNLLKQVKPLLSAVLFSAAFLLPLIRDALVGDGLTRAGTLIFSRANSVSEFFQLLWLNLQNQVGLDFWVRGATTTLRHSDGQTGVIFWFDLVAIVIAFGWFGIRRWQKISWSWWDKFSWLSLIWTIIGLLPAIFASETPHPNRAFLAILGLGWLSVAGWLAFLRWLKIKLGQKQFFICLSLILFGYISALGLYQWRYYTEFKQTSAEDFFDGYLEAAEIAVAFEKYPQAGQEVDKILFTDYYGQPYIFVLLARKTNPIWYQGGALIKYEFVSSLNVGDLNRQKTLVIASPKDDLPIERADKLIYGSDGKIKFKIYYPHSELQL